MLTDYHLHLRPDEDGHDRRALLHRPRTSTATWRPPRRRDRGARRLRARLPLHARRSSSGATRSGRARRATTSTPTASSCARRRCGSASRATSSPAPRTASRTCSRRATSTTWSARSTSSASDAVDHDGWDVWDGQRRPGRGLAPLLRVARRVRPLAACSTSSPTPTWSRSGARPARCPSATCASSTSPRSRRSPRAGSRSRSRPPGCASRSARSTRRRGFAEMCVEAGADFALSSDAHLPEQVGFGYDRALEFLDELGVERDLRLRAAPAPPRAARQPRSES